MQYEVGKTFEEDKAILCNRGLHFCENPLDVLAYYSPDDSRYCTVEADDVSNQKDDDSKRVCKKLTIKAEIGLLGLMKAAVEYINSSVDNIKKEINSGYRSAAVNSGDSSAAVNSGDSSAAEVSGEESVAVALGIDSKAKGALGCWLVLSEWCFINGEYHRVNVKCRKVDGKHIKPDKYYALINNNFVEV